MGLVKRLLARLFKKERQSSATQPDATPTQESSDVAERHASELARDTSPVNDHSFDAGSGSPTSPHVPSECLAVACTQPGQTNGRPIPPALTFSVALALQGPEVTLPVRNGTTALLLGAPLTISAMMLPLQGLNPGIIPAIRPTAKRIWTQPRFILDKCIILSSSYLMDAKLTGPKLYIAPESDDMSLPSLRSSSTSSSSQQTGSGEDLPELPGNDPSIEPHDPCVALAGEFAASDETWLAPASWDTPISSPVESGFSYSHPVHLVSPPHSGYATTQSLTDDGDDFRAAANHLHGDSLYLQSNRSTESFSSCDSAEGVPPLHFGDHTFTIEKEIGRGGFGFVWLAHTEDGEEVAIKVMHKQSMLADMFPRGTVEPGDVPTPEQVQGASESKGMPDTGACCRWKHARSLNKQAARMVYDEFTVLRRVTQTGSPFLTPLLYSFSDNNHFYFVMRMYPMNLRDAMTSMACTSTPILYGQAKIWAAELLVALETLHQQNIIHRDLKAENILVTPSGHICLADFGLAHIASMSENLQDVTMSSMCGTSGYMSPEQKHGSTYNYKSDMYGYGLILLEMLIGEGAPWFAYLDTQIDPNDLEPGDARVRTVLKYVQDADARVLLCSLFTRYPHKRPDWDAIRESAFFDGFDWDAIKRRQYLTLYTPHIASDRLKDPTSGIYTFQLEHQISCDLYQDIIDEGKNAKRAEGLGGLNVDYVCPAKFRVDPIHGQVTTF